MVKTAVIFFTNLKSKLFLEFGWKDTVSDKISTFYDVGGIIGWCWLNHVTFL